MSCDCEDNGVSCCVGVNLRGETGASVMCLGFVQAPRKQLYGGTLAQLRECLTLQIPSVPHNYTFITKQGWPVSKSQEASLKSSHLITDEKNTITIQSAYEKPRVGINAKSGMCLGFVLVHHNVTLHQLRVIIEEQLPFFSGLSHSYQFVDTNGWPVHRHQEVLLTVVQVLVGSCVTVCTDITMRALLEYQDMGSLSMSTVDGRESITDRSHARGPRELGIFAKKDQSRESVGHADNVVHKQILISYVRAEAAHHALQLKTALKDSGCSVFLDVHEIKMGVDWQDSLNNAVSNCEVFVPLVTPRYGETQWTNREVKLADVLNKFILPVSFLDEWPPRCLAIQFATTQFVPWEKPQSDNQSVFLREDNPFCPRDIYKWSEESTKEVAMEIIERIRQHRDSKKGTVLLKQRSVLRSYPNILAGIDMEDIEEVKQNREGLPMVVIIVHQENQAVGEELKKKLEDKNYDVWCTTEIETQEDDIMSSQSDSMWSPSVQSCMSSDASDSIISSRRIFQEKANEAGVVIMIVSKAFTRSKTCKQQVFYCEHRKRVIPLRIENFPIPGWLMLLLGNTKFENGTSEGYESALLDRVGQALDPSQDDSFIEESNEAELLKTVQTIWKSANRDNAVYISGSTTFHNANSEAICKSIGSHLARMEDITLVTGGFYGVGESVGRTFYEETQRMWKQHSVLHVLPTHEAKIQTEKADQNADGSYNPPAYGRTELAGNSLHERECIVARAFAICILVEGGPGAAHEAEQFIWSDHIVIPIRSTGGAAAGEFGVPAKIFECPRGVDECSWNKLNQPDLSPKEVGQVVSTIVRTLHNTNKSLKQTDKVNTPQAKRQRRLKGVSMPADSSPPSLATMKTMMIG